MAIDLSKYKLKDNLEKYKLPVVNTATPPTSVTDPARPLPGADTAVMPARSSAQMGEGFNEKIEKSVQDTAKIVPNALGDIWNLIKEGTYGTAKKIVYDIPKAIYGLATDNTTPVRATQEARDKYLNKTGVDVYKAPDNMTDTNKVKNVIRSVVPSALEVGGGLIPQSAKELANWDAIKDIPNQFKAVVDQNDGSYAKALLETIKSMPGSIPEATQNYANQIDRARQSIENHPVNEFLGWMGLKSLVSGKGSPVKTKEAFQKPFEEAVTSTKETVLDLPGADIPGKVVRRAQDARLANEELKQQPKPIQTAVKADIPEPQAKLIHDANIKEKALMNEMLTKHKKGIKESVMEPAERPDAVIGNEVMKTIKFLEDQKKSTIREEGNHVQGLKGQVVDYSRTANDFLDRLSLENIKIDGEGNLDFSSSRLKGPASAKDRGLLNLAWDELKPNEMGEYRKPADQLHITRQTMFDETQPRNFTEPFNNRIVDIVNNDTGTSVRSGILRDINEQVKGSGAGYKATATKNAIIQDALQEIYKLLGKDAKGNSIDINNLKAGEIANRLEGNASAKIESAFKKIEDAAKKYGFEKDISIRKLVAFKTILKNILGETQHNSLAGGVEQGVKAALPDALDVVGNASSGAIVGTVKAVGKFIKSNTKAEQIRALEELLLNTEVPKTNKPPSAVRRDDPF